MSKHRFSYIFIVLATLGCLAQNNIDIKAHLDASSNALVIHQNITYKNTSQDTLNTIYLNDWNQSYASKSTPLALRFEEEFSTKFHLAKDKQRGYTDIEFCKNDIGQDLDIQYTKAHPDVLEVKLQQSLLPGAIYKIQLRYISKIPDASFTGYGYTKNQNFNLKYWYITPAIYDGKWHYYSNKNLDDLYIPKSNITIEFTHPIQYKLNSELDVIALNPDLQNNRQTTVLKGENRIDSYLQLSTNPRFLFHETKDFTLLSDIESKNLTPLQKGYIAEKVATFLNNQLGLYPHKKLLVSQTEYDKSPLYGVNQLPSFLQPFSDAFQYEIKLVKTALKKYLENTLLINPRKSHWLNDGIKIYFLMNYVESYYPKTKLFGSLSKVWGIRSFHAAKLDYNFQYFLYFMEIARKNRDQPLSTSKDSLIKFNANIANKYKAGIGLKYLDDFAEDIALNKTLKEFIRRYKLNPITIKDFEDFIKSKTKKDINWFFGDYVSTRKKIDFKIKTVKEETDSITITIKNKRNNTMPVSLFKIKNDTVFDKIWIEDIKDTKTIKVAKDSTQSYILGYNNALPEYNQRDNYKSLTSSFFNKPLQIRLLQDVEDPNYNQVFVMPLIEFRNIYDGLTLGTRLYNKTVLTRRLNYRVAPLYATRSRTMTGAASVFYTHFLENQNLFDITYGVSATYQSFAQDAFFTRIRPSIVFSFRDDKDFRKDQRDILTARFVNIQRRIGENAIPEEIEDINEPDYSVFNLRYVHAKPGVINFKRFATDFQIANQFSKLSLSYEYRKLTKSNRNINIRLFAGTFLNNTTNLDSDYFSFALDRPTDYLFDLNYLGRSEDSGLFSQQIIIAEGGFKSQLQNPYANQWMATANFSTSIWRYIQAYGDIGVIKNKFQNSKFVYDSGIRLNLVEDFFEIYFPVYSNLGWEIAQPNYDQSIRFMITLSPKVLLGLFTRKWY